MAGILQPTPRCQATQTAQFSVTGLSHRPVSRPIYLVIFFFPLQNFKARTPTPNSIYFQGRANKTSASAQMLKEEKPLSLLQPIRLSDCRQDTSSSGEWGHQPAGHSLPHHPQLMPGHTVCTITH